MMQLVMAGALLLLALARIPAVRNNGRDPVFLAAVFACASSVLGSPGVYVVVDFLVGGFNLVRLAVNTLMVVGLWYLRSAVVNAVSPDADPRRVWLRLVPLAVTLALQVAFFFLTGPLPSNVAWGEFHNLPYAVPFSLMMILFIAWSCSEIAWACFRFAPRMSPTFRSGFSMVGAGCLISVATMALMALEAVRPTDQQPPFHLMELCAVVLVGIGLTIPAVSGRVARQRAAQRLARIIAKVEPIREKALQNADMERLLATDARALPQERLHRMIVEIWDAELAAGTGNSALTDTERAYLLTVDSDLDLERVP